MSSVDRWRAGVREYKDPPFTASYPLDVIVGKVLGRAGVIGSAALVGLTIGPGFGFLLLGSVELLPAIVFIGTTAVFSLVYTSIIIGLSATSGSTTRSAALAIGYFVIFELMWDVAPLAIVWIVHGFSLPERFPDWVFIVSQVPPSAAYILTLVC